MKYLFIGLAFLVGIYACQWLFNHINPWIGIVAGVALAFYAIHLVIKQTKKYNEKN